MASSVDPTVLQRTKETLGKVIKKPPLTDKLLSRPPFRYLHDIISEIGKATRFFKGLYTAQELDAKSIQDKDAKTAFLQKAIDTLSFTNGEIVRVKPSKIVAGHEVEKTNEFLQLLAIAIMKELDSSEAIQRVLKGEKPSETLGKEKKRRDKGGSKENGHESSKKRSKSKERTEDGRNHSGGGAARTKPRDSSKDAADSPSSLRSKSQKHLKEKQTERPTHRPSRTRPPPPESEPTPQNGTLEEPAAENQVGDRDKDNAADDEGLGSETQLDRPPSAKGSRKRPPPPEDSEKTGGGDTLNGTTHTENNAAPASGAPESHDAHITTADDAVTATQSPSPPPQSLVPVMKRPNSARPAPPKIIKTATSLEDMNAKISSSNSADGAVLPSVILDTPGQDHDLDDDDDQYVVEDSAHLAQPPSEAFLSSTMEGVPGSEKAEGVLTKNIVAMKQRLEGDLTRSGDQQQSDQPAISEAQRRKEREMVAREIEKLQSSIQTLCKSANPLGKIMDYVQEDMDSMQKELDMWKQENERHSESLRKEESITEHELAPLRSQLEELETRIKEQVKGVALACLMQYLSPSLCKVDLISTTKANILKNEEKAQQLLNSMAFAS